MESTVILDQTFQTAQQFIIQTIGLGKYYQKKKVTAVKELNLQIPRNSICGFLGPNGAGKSTAIKLLLGLTRLSWGSGQIFGLDIVRESIEIRQRIGYLGQSPHFYAHMSARETLRFALHFFYFGPSAAIEEQVAEALDLVGLTGSLCRIPLWHPSRNDALDDSDYHSWSSASRCWQAYSSWESLSYDSVMRIFKAAGVSQARLLLTRYHSRNI